MERSKPIEYRGHERFSNLENNIEFLNGKISKKDNILEIGSGCGDLLSYLQKQGYHAVGTDVSESGIAIAKRFFPAIKITKMSGDRLQFPNRSFDVVLSFDVLEHIPDTGKHLREVFRVLKRKGVYIFQTPNKITNRLAEFLWVTFTGKSRWPKELHCSLQTYPGLKRALSQNGFDFRFYKINPVTKHTLTRVRGGLGTVGAFAFRMFPWELLPMHLQTNFYVVARKKS